MIEAKPAGDLTVEDFRRHSVWKFTNNDADETMVSPIETFPMSDLQGCLIGTTLRFKNGSEYRGILSNIDLRSLDRTQQLQVLTLFIDEGRFNLAHYSEPDYSSRSPERLAQLLNIAVDDIFPIYYDVSNVAAGDVKILKGYYPRKPIVELTDEEIIRMALE